jgi:putative membrane protein
MTGAAPDQPSGAADTSGERPDYRFSLANERTFLAWVRTALALLAAGIGVIDLPSGISHRGREALGVLLVVIGLVAAVGSLARWRANDNAIRHGRPLPDSPVMPAVALGVVVVAIIALALVIAYLA